MPVPGKLGAPDYPSPYFYRTVLGGNTLQFGMFSLCFLYSLKNNFD